MTFSNNLTNEEQLIKTNDIIINMSSRFLVAIVVLSTLVVSILMLDVVHASGLVPTGSEGRLKPGESINFTISNETEVDDVELKYIHPGKTGWRNCTMEIDDEKMYCELSLDQGNYRYYFETEGERLPHEGYFKLFLSEGKSDLYDIAKELIQSTPESPKGCDPWNGEYSCKYESWQGSMIQGFVDAYRVTGNETYRNKILDLSLSKIDTVRLQTRCDHTEEEFDCRYFGDPPYETKNITPSILQGSMIGSMWNSYEATGNSTVREIAMNYTLGSAEDCDVWGNRWEQSFECDEPEGQALMIEGYWDAYRATGNRTFMEVAEELAAQANKESYNITSALWRSYGYTENETTRETAENLTFTGLDYCMDGGCSAGEFSRTLKNNLEAYRATGDYGYYRYSIETGFADINDVCNKSSTNCSADLLGKLISAYWKAYKTIPVNERDISKPRIIYPLPATTNSFLVSLSGTIEDVDFFIGRVNENSWKRYSVSKKTEEATVPAWTTASQGPYKFYFDHKDGRFPEDGSFVLSMSHENETLESIGRSFIETDPVEFHDQEYCKPWEDSYSCGYEDWQASMIQGFVDAYRATGDGIYRDKIEFLSTERIDKTEHYRTSCCHTRGSFDCKSRDPPYSDRTVAGSIRQGSMIGSMWNSYEATGNSTVREIAMNYTLGSAEDCDVWEQSFECDEPEGQALMIEGYWDAYRATGNRTFMEVAEELAESSLGMEGTTNLGRSLWESYSYTENDGFNQRAKEITDQKLGYCIDEKCTPSELSDSAMLSLRAYKSTNNETYLNDTVEKVSSGDGACENTEEFQCKGPINQSKISKMYLTSSRSLPIELNASHKTKISEDEPAVGSSFELNTTIKNEMEDVVLYNISTEISTDEGLETQENKTKEYEKLGPGEKKTMAWIINTDSPGEKNISVAIESRNDWKSTDQTTIYVEGTNGDENGVSRPSEPTERVETENYTWEYTESDIIGGLMERKWLWEEITKRELGISVQRTYSYARCFHGERRYTPSDGKLSLEVTYGCAEPTGYVIFGDDLRNITHDSGDNLIETDPRTEILNKTSNYLVFRKANMKNDSKISVNYTIDSDSDILDHIKKPFILLSESKPPEVSEIKIDVVEPNFTVTENENIDIILEVESPTYTECRFVEGSSGSYVVEGTKRIEENIGLDLGRNEIEFYCLVTAGGYEEIDFNVFRQVKVSTVTGVGQKPMNTLYIIGLLTSVLTLMSFVVIKRTEIYITAKKIYLEYLLKRVEKLLKEGSLSKAYEVYHKLDKVYQDIHGIKMEQKKLEERLGSVARGLKIYILMEMTDEMIKNGEIEKGIENMQSIHKLTERFLEEGRSKELKDRIKENYMSIIESLNNIPEVRKFVG